jgi:hypothetical protein
MITRNHEGHEDREDHEERVVAVTNDIDADVVC